MLYLLKHNNKYLTRSGLLVISEGYRPTRTRSGPKGLVLCFQTLAVLPIHHRSQTPMGTDQSQKRDCQVLSDCWHLEKWQQVRRKRGRSRLTKKRTWRGYFSLGKYKARCVLVVAETYVSPARQPSPLDNPTNSCATTSHTVFNSTLAASKRHQNIAIH